MATRVEQAQIGAPGTIRNKPITVELVAILDAAAAAAGIDRVVVGSGGQPAHPGTPRKGSTRHDNGRAADFKLYQGGKVLTFTDQAAPPAVVRFITECARLGATGIGASVEYMGNQTFHVGFGLTPSDRTHVVWGGEAANSAGAPKWLRDAATAGWTSPAPVPRPRPTQPAREPEPADTVGPGGMMAGGAIAVGGATTGNGWVLAAGAVLLAAGLIIFLIRKNRRT